MPSYLVDTHRLVWFIAEDDRLSRRVARLLAQAEMADVQVLVPTIVLAEITYIAEKKRVKVAADRVWGWVCDRSIRPCGASEHAATADRVGDA